MNSVKHCLFLVLTISLAVRQLRFVDVTDTDVASIAVVYPTIIAMPCTTVAYVAYYLLRLINFI